MRVVMFESGANPSRLGVLRDQERVVDVRMIWESLSPEQRPPIDSPECLTDILQLLRGGQSALAAAQGLAERGTAAQVGVLRMEDVRLQAPLSRPGKIIAIGRNYGDHLAESQRIWKERGVEVPRPSFPAAFFKVPSSVVGPDDDVIYPRQTEQLDYEVELAVVIGRRAFNVEERDALDYVAGYTVLNDVSARDRQKEEQQQGLGIVLGKGFDTFCPIGPCVVTSDEIPDPNALGVQLRVNGEIRQDSNTRFLLFNVQQLIAYWSRMTLEPGDIIATGTPSGVALARRPDPTPYWLKPGDVVEATVEGIGTLRNRIRHWSESGKG